MIWSIGNHAMGGRYGVANTDHRFASKGFYTISPSYGESERRQCGARARNGPAHQSIDDKQPSWGPTHRLIASHLLPLHDRSSGESDGKSAVHRVDAFLQIFQSTHASARRVTTFLCHHAVTPSRFQRYKQGVLVSERHGRRGLSSNQIRA